MIRNKKLREEFERFRQWLLDEGLSDRTSRTYVRIIRSCLKRRSILAVVRDPNSSRSTKIGYRSALTKWATYKGDNELLSSLQSPRLSREVKHSGKKIPKKVKPIPKEQMDQFIRILDRIREKQLGPPWVWPAISLFRKLALRARVDLCQIQRDSLLESLGTGELQIWTKGDRIRSVPIGQVREEIEALLDLGEWATLADVISPNSKTGQTEAAYKQVVAWLRAIAKTAGMDPSEVHSHRFRHTRAIELYEASGHDIRVVQEFLGHKSIETTQCYIQVALREIDEHLGKLR